MPLRIVLLVIILIGVIAGRAGQGFLPALNTPLPPLAKEAPHVEPAAVPALARRVVLVVVDGLRWDASRGRAMLDALRARGVDAKARAPFPTISKANYVTVMSGVPPRYSGARTNDGFREHLIDSLFDRMAAVGRRAGYVADKTRGIARLFGVEDAVRAPLGQPLTDAVAASLARNDLVALLLMEVDGAGHTEGGTSPEYDAAVRAIDAQLARLVETFDFTRDTLVITADHGHTSRGGHGGQGPDVEDVPLVLVGAGVRAGATPVVRPELVDVAPTVAALLGLSSPGHSSGRTLVELLALTPEQQQAFAAADARRLAHVGAIVERIDADDHAAADRELWTHGVVALVGIAALAALIVVSRRRGWARFDRAVVGAGLVYPIVFFALELGVDRLSELPTVPASRLAVWYHTALYGGIAVIFHAIAGTLVARRSSDRERTVVGIMLVGAMATIVPALVAWTIAGPARATLVPGTEMMIAAPYASVAVAHHALAAVLLCMLAGQTRTNVPDR